MAHIVTVETVVCPDWVDINDDESFDEGHDFTLSVKWMGGGRYAICQGAVGMSGATRQYNWVTGQFTLTQRGFGDNEELRAQHRFSYGDALELALRLVNDLRVNGRTREEWDIEFKRRDAARDRSTD